jgi:phenylalanyl-tRNA synthetase beta chain
MWISLKIIENLVDIKGITPEQIAERLTMSTAEIEGIEYINSHFKTIYTAKLTKVKPHPDADKLTLCEVYTGKETLQVVCGAKNHKEGDIVALATIGTKFSDDFEIKKTKIRGVESNGMLCSLKELGLSDDHSGILIFPPDTQIGVPLSEIYNNWVDVRLTIDNKSITHRPDLWGHIGFAREISTLFGREMKNPVNYKIKEKFKNLDNLAVKILNPEVASRYCGLVVRNIKIAESPEWLKARVSAIGMRPINNIVDITNYVMAEIGEPMHAFDRKKLRGNTIFVRLASDNEKIVTLDGREHNLTSEDIVIADAEGPIALAGVMGGGNSDIDENTTEIVLEAATFNPVNIRKTAQRFDSRTEAAMRFEKSLSPEIAADAIIRCFELITEIIPEAEAVTEIVDDYPVKPKKIIVDLSTDYIRKKIGVSLKDEEIVKTLTSLSFGVNNNNGNLSVEVPHFRATKDISMKDDIVEEVGRVFGYSNIPAVPPMIPCIPPISNDFRYFEREVKNILSNAFGLTEVSGYSFTGEDILNRLKINDNKELRLKNPLSRDHDRLRRTMITNVIQFIQYNQRFQESFDIYELGRVYLKEDRKSPELAKENFRVAGTVFMKRPPEPLFFEAKTIVRGLLDKLRVKNYTLTPETKELPPYAHPNRSMKVFIEGEEAGLVFELHPETIKAFEITGKAAVFDLDLNAIFDAEKKAIKFTELPKFPEVQFEISVVADKYVYSEDILNVIKKSDPSRIRDVSVISVYQGSQIPEDKKSVSFRIIFADREKTLEPSEIEALQNKVIENIKKASWSLR